MTKNWLEYDQKIFTTANPIFRIWPKFMTPTNINFTPKNMLVRSAWTGPPAPARKLELAHLPILTSPIALLLYKKKQTGTEVKRNPDVKLSFVGFIRFVDFIRYVGFNFGQIQKIKFVVVMVRSYSFSHLDLVKWITLILFYIEYF